MTYWINFPRFPKKNRKNERFIFGCDKVLYGVKMETQNTKPKKEKPTFREFEKLINKVKNAAIDNAFQELRDDIEQLFSEIQDIRSILREHNIFHKPPKDVLVY